MTQFRGEGWPIFTGSTFVFTAGETAEMFHKIIMDAPAGEYEETQRRVVVAMENIVAGKHRQEG